MLAIVTQTAVYYIINTSVASVANGSPGFFVLSFVRYVAFCLIDASHSFTVSDSDPGSLQGGK